MENQLDIFYNTIPLKDEELKKSRINAGTQNALVLEFFRRHPDGEFTPFQVWRSLNLPKAPVTSIRRSMTTLTKLGYLQMTSVKRPGEYGVINNCWKWLRDKVTK